MRNHQLYIHCGVVTYHWIGSCMTYTHSSNPHLQSIIATVLAQRVGPSRHVRPEQFWLQARLGFMWENAPLQLLPRLTVTIGRLTAAFSPAIIHSHFDSGQWKKCLDNCTSLLLWTKFWFTLNDAYICQNRWIFREKLWSVFDPSPPRPFFRKIHCNFCWWRNEYI